MPLDFTCEHGLLRDLWLYLLGPENPPISKNKVVTVVKEDLISMIAESS